MLTWTKNVRNSISPGEYTPDPYSTGFAYRGVPLWLLSRISPCLKSCTHHRQYFSYVIWILQLLDKAVVIWGACVLLISITCISMLLFVSNNTWKSLFYSIIVLLQGSEWNASNLEELKENGWVNNYVNIFGHLVIACSQLWGGKIVWQSSEYLYSG